jgi:hypothetical protein
VTTTPDPADPPTPGPDSDADADDRTHDPLGLSPNSPGISASRPLDDPSQSDVEPNEPA